MWMKEMIKNYIEKKLLFLKVCYNVWFGMQPQPRKNKIAWFKGAVMSFFLDSVEIIWHSIGYNYNIHKEKISNFNWAGNVRRAKYHSNCKV